MHPSLLCASFILVQALAANPALRQRALQSPSIDALELIAVDSLNPTVVAQLVDQSVVTIDPSSSYNIIAVATPQREIPPSDKVVSVKFGYNGDENFRIESTGIFAFCGNFGKRFVSCDELVEGTHTVTVTPYSGRNATGSVGVTTTITFKLVTAPEESTKHPTGNPTQQPTTEPVPGPAQAITPGSTHPWCKFFFFWLDCGTPASNPQPQPTLQPIAVPVASPVPVFVPPSTLQPVVVPVAPRVPVIESQPTPQPIMTPVAQPIVIPTGTSNDTCKAPKFVGDWQRTKKYPIPVAEAQGAIVGNDFIVISGFFEGYGQATDKCYALDMTDPDADWRPIADLPISEGITHAASVVIENKLYVCGGFLGGHPGPHIDTCLVYNHANNTWRFFDPLPEGRAGGGMVYSSVKNALVFSAGAERPVGGDSYTDYQHTWMYSFGSPEAGWVEKADIPYLTNHMSYVTTKDQTGRERHFFLAGQMGEDEYEGNVDDNYEWDVGTETWIEKKSLPFTRGHASASTNAANCGFLIAAGSTNGSSKTADVSYYDVPTDTWTKVGDLPSAINTPVCDIDKFGGWYFCFTGWATGKFATKIKIEL